MKRLLFVLATIGAAVAAMTTSAAASTSTGAAAPVSETVSIFGCLGNGGQATVAAGSTVTFRGGWEDNQLGFIKNFLNDVTVTASVNGTQIANANSYWSTPEVFTPEPGVTGWITWWTYPTGITLGAGQSLTFATDWVLSHPLASGFPQGQVIPAGSVFGGPISCTVTDT